MKKFLFLYPFLTYSLLLAYTYNDLLLKTQASIFPKIITLDKNIQTKLINNTIVLSIIYEKDDFFTAKKIKDIIENSFADTIEGYALKVNLIEVSQLSSTIQATAFYVLNLSDNALQKVAQIATHNHIMTFSYDLNNLRKGLLFSITMEQSTTFYVNKENLQNEKVDFISPLLQMVKFIDKENS